VFLLTRFLSCEFLLLQLNAIFTSVYFQTYKEFPNIKLQTQIFTTVRLAQFSVSKSTPSNVTSHITVQSSCSNTEVVNPLHSC